jgi:hypothetical protein
MFVPQHAKHHQWQRQPKAQVIQPSVFHAPKSASVAECGAVGQQDGLLGTWLGARVTILIALLGELAATLWLAHPAIRRLRSHPDRPGDQAA